MFYRKTIAISYAYDYKIHKQIVIFFLVRKLPVIYITPFYCRSFISSRIYLGNVLVMKYVNHERCVRRHKRLGHFPHPSH